jgi:drug/metabolite transporter (DMT)-like permease
MYTTIGIGLAFVAMLCWGFGDFFIQRSTRKIGNWETLFVMTVFGALVLLPFVWKTVPGVVMRGGNTLGILILASAVLFVAALLDFEGLREGKLSVSLWAGAAASLTRSWSISSRTRSWPF